MIGNANFAVNSSILFRSIRATLESECTLFAVRACLVSPPRNAARGTNEYAHAASASPQSRRWREFSSQTDSCEYL